MGLNRVITNDQAVDLDNKDKLKKRFKNKLAAATTLDDAMQLIKILSRHVFNESDGV